MAPTVVDHPSANPARHTWFWAILALGTLAALCARLASGGIPVQTEYPFATSILLDAGARIRDGQIPYHDFHTPIGFTYLGLVAFCMALAHGLPHALALLSAGAGLLLGAWVWHLAVARCPAPLAAALAVLTGLLAASPALFGYGPFDVSYGGHYSRLAWGLLAAVVVQAALPVRSPAGAVRTWSEGLGLGACLGLLVGIKFTFGFAGLVILAAAWWYRRPDRRIAIALPIGALAAVLAGLALSGATLSGYLRDCASLGNSASLIDLVGQYKRKLDFLALALIGAMALWTWPAHRAAWRRSWRQPLPEGPLLAALALALGLVLSASTGIEDASPCYLLALVVLAVTTPRSEADSGARRAALLIAGAALCAFAARLALPIIKGPYAAASHRLTLAAGPWQGLDFMPAVEGTTETGRLLPQVWIQPRNLVDNLWYLYLSEGDALLRPRIGAQERVLSLDYINPFPYQLGLPAPRGDLLFWSFDRNVSPRTAPPPELLFAEADWVMVPKRELFHDSSQPKQALYLDWVKAHYRLEASNPGWDCYRRPAR